MSLSPPTLSVIQQAGQALHIARQAVSRAVQENAEQMVATVASQPFSPESDQAFAKLRTVARLAHELNAMEEQLKVLYASAVEMMKPPTPVLTALAGPARDSRFLSADAREDAEEAVVKTMPSRTPKIRQGQREKPHRQSRNDAKVLGYLKTVLDRRSWKFLTQADIANGSDIPLGSVGLALRRLAVAGILREGNKGAYRL